MAQRSHVPKFGDWDSDNVPYTTYFENARKGKASGVRMNPNDPEENPEAFMSIRGDPESDGVGRANKTSLPEKHHIEGHTGHNGHRRNPSESHKKSDGVGRANKTFLPEKHHIEGHTGHSGHHRNPSGSHKNIKPESGSDKSGSDNSLLHPNHHRMKSDRKKSLVESSNSFSSSLPGPTRVRTGNHPYDDIHHRTASVPKFGAWDETDPKSGDGFTVIFNKVKEEKQIASSKFPTVPPQPRNYSVSQEKQGSSSSVSKICCCLFPSGSK